MLVIQVLLKTTSENIYEMHLFIITSFKIMKRLSSSVSYLLLTTLLFLNVEVKAQALVPVGTKWYYGYVIYGIEPTYTWPFTYECIRLETKNNKIYSVIKCSEPISSGNADSLFYLRSDSGKVYQWLSQDYLVFDFTKNVGDTLILGKNSYKYTIWKKYYTKNYSSTDSLLSFDIFNISQYTFSHVCEKILKLDGYSHYNFTDYNDRNIIPEGDGFGIRCFDIPSIIDSFHLSKPGTLCDYSGDWYPGAQLSVKENSGDQSLSIFPNPVDDVLNISSEKIISSIDFYNTEGIKIMSIQTHENSIAVNPHLYGLKNGLYLLTIKSGEKVSHYKILVK